MPTAVWPVDLPDRSPGVVEQLEPNIIRTPTEVGPAKMRRRFTAAVRRYRVPVQMNGTQKAIFDAFFRDTIKDGTLPFEWEDPMTHETVEMRFADTPEFEKIIGASNPDNSHWFATLNLEVLP